MKFKRFLTAVTVLTLALTLGACSASDDPAQTEETETSGLTDATQIELTQVKLTGSSAEIDGDGAQEADGVLTISAGGVYVLQGNYDGRIEVDASGESVTLELSGAQLTSSTGPAIWAKNGDLVTISAQSGTENTVALLESYVPGTDDPNAAIYAKTDLVISGSGALTVTGGVCDGINGRDTLSVSDLTLTVTAVDDGIVGKDCVVMENAAVTVTAGGDAIKSTNADDAALGYVTLADGSYTLTAGNDAVQAETSLEVTGGSFTIATGGGVASASTLDSTGSYKGLKAGTTLTVSDGEFVLDCADDALHADTVTIRGGTLSIASGDDGVHADSDLTVSGGTLDITQSYEGLEGMTVTLSGGSVAIVSTDDGVNCAGGADASGFGGPFGTNAFEGSDECVLTISGGELFVEAGGDGLDSNGSIEMTGGSVLVYGPTDNANGSLDYNTTCLVSGGTLIAAGSSGMAQAPTADSSQNSLVVYLSQAEAGSEVTVTDADGAVVTSFTPTKAFSWLLICAPELETGESYTVTVAGTETGTATVESSLTTLGTATGMGGFGGNGGGGRFDGGQGQAPTDGTVPDDSMTPPDGTQMPTQGERPTDGEMPEGMTPPDGTAPETGTATDGTQT